MSEGRREGIVEDDLEYDGDAAADVDVDVELEPEDPANVPPDEGDPGQPESREGDG